MADAIANGAGDADRALLPVENKALLTIGVMGAQIMQILDTTIANVALPHMQANLGATVDTISWVLTSYIVATAIALPATGWLASRIGSRRLFLIAIGGFVVASMLCGAATNLGAMVAFRAMQGMFAAFINPLSQTTMLDTNKPSNHARAMSIWGMGVMVAPIMGPVLGGWLTENYSWRWVFYVNVPIGAAAFAILWFLLPARPDQPRGFDKFGFALVAIAMASFQLLLDRGQQEDWFDSGEIIFYALVCVAAVWMTVVHIATARRPLFDRALFRNRNLLVSTIFMLVIGTATMAPLALLPAMLQQLFDYPVITTGLVVAPRGAGVLIATFISGRLTGKVDTRLIIMTGFLLFAYSVHMMSGWTLDMDTGPVITCGIIQGFGMGFVFMPLNSLAFATLPAAERTDGASLLNLSRSIGQSAGISMVTTLLARNIQQSHADLVQHLSPDKLPGPAVAMDGGIVGFVGDALSLLDAMVNRQAAMIAYLDDFYLMAWVSVAVAPLVLLLRRPRGRVAVVISE